MERQDINVDESTIDNADEIDYDPSGTEGGWL